MPIRRKVFRVLILLVLAALVFPVAKIAYAYLDTKEAEVHASLESQRASLTQLANHKHALDTYAKRLHRDNQLRSVVHTHNHAHASWQTIEQDIRLRLIDGINEMVEKQEPIASVSVDWLDSPNQRELTNRKKAKDNNKVIAQGIGLSATADSVPHVLQLLASMQVIATPYPLNLLGCSYWRTNDTDEIKADCVLTLETWGLPQVLVPDGKDQDALSSTFNTITVSVEHSVAESATHLTTHSVANSAAKPAANSAAIPDQPLNSDWEAQADSSKNFHTQSLADWRLLKSNRSVKQSNADEIDVKSNAKMRLAAREKNSGTINKSSRRSTSYRLSKAIITGPAGKLVIHGSEK